MGLEITDANFQETVLQSDKPVIVDFWAVWCGPCRMIAPIMDEIAQEFGDKVVVGKLNVDENPAVTAQFGIMNIPTVLYFKNGQVAEKIVGALPKSKFVEKLQPLL